MSNIHDELEKRKITDNQFNPKANYAKLYKLGYNDAIDDAIELIKSDRARFREELKKHFCECTSFPEEMDCTNCNKINELLGDKK